MCKKNLNVTILSPLLKYTLTAVFAFGTHESHLFQVRQWNPKHGEVEETPSGTGEDPAVIQAFVRSLKQRRMRGNTSSEQLDEQEEDALQELTYLTQHNATMLYMKNVFDQFSDKILDKTIDSISFRPRPAQEPDKDPGHSETPGGWLNFENAVAFSLIKSRPTQLTCYTCVLAGKPSSQSEPSAHDLYGYHRHMVNHLSELEAHSQNQSCIE